jgi:thiamine-monophosphate kinase
MPSGRSRRTSSVGSEFGLIRLLQAQAARPDRQVFKGIGDDTAILKTSSDEWTLITTDLLAEGVHFNPATSSYEDIGYRAAIANLSDIAAMGGTPRFMLVAIAIPPTCSTEQIQRLYRGMMQAADPYRVCLVGGDTSASRYGLFLSITLTGTVQPRRALLRSGARVGDRLYVTGTLGDSRAGLDLLTATARAGAAKLRPTHTRFLLARHHRPSARIAEGQWLVKHGLAGAAIDLSDGLTGDLRHLCEESGVGAEVLAGSLPISPACLAYALAHGRDPQQIGLQGGEDYELLFTVPRRKQEQFERLAEKTGFCFTCIGSITPKRLGLRLRTAAGTAQPLPAHQLRTFSAALLAISGTRTSMADVRSLFRQVLHLDETPHRTALAFAIGSFIGFSPAYGLHMVMVGFCAWAFGLNVVALLAGAFLNNPWTLIPILGGTYWTGATLLGVHDFPSFDWSDLSFMGIYHQVMPYAWPFFVGGMVLSIAGGLLAYPLAYLLLSKYRRANPTDGHQPLPPSSGLR